MNPEQIEVEVVCAEPDRQTVCRLRVPVGCSAGEALQLSRVLDSHPGIDAGRFSLGIFGQEVTAKTVLQGGDRVEVLRPLPMDPRERRRLLARQGKTMGGRSAR